MGFWGFGVLGFWGFVLVNESIEFCDPDARVNISQIVALSHAHLRLCLIGPLSSQALMGTHLDERCLQFAEVFLVLLGSLRVLAEHVHHVHHLTLHRWATVVQVRALLHV